MAKPGKTTENAWQTPHFGREVTPHDPEKDKEDDDGWRGATPGGGAPFCGRQATDQPMGHGDGDDEGEDSPSEDEDMLGDGDGDDDDEDWNHYDDEDSSSGDENMPSLSL